MLPMHCIHFKLNFLTFELTALFIDLCCITDVPSEAEKGPVFQFEASQHNIELYGTLPHKKKSKSTTTTPLKGQQTSRFANQSFGGVQDTSLSSMRRAEGFSRLLEFTRQQVAIEFDVTQSLPVMDRCLLSTNEEMEVCDIGTGIEDIEKMAMSDFGTGNEESIDQDYELQYEEEKPAPYSDKTQSQIVETTTSARDAIEEHSTEGLTERPSTEGVIEADVNSDNSYSLTPLVDTPDSIEQESEEPSDHLEEEYDVSVPSAPGISATANSHGEYREQVKWDKSYSHSQLTGVSADTRETDEPLHSVQDQTSANNSQTRTQDLVRSGSGLLSRWWLGRFSNFMPSKTSLVAVGVAVAASVMFIFISGYFK